jgi:hypothetical protein
MTGFSVDQWNLSLHLPRLRTLQIRNSATLPDAIADLSSLSDDGAIPETVDLFMVNQVNPQ